MTEEEEIFALFLKGRNLRLTAVRKALMEFVSRTNGVFDETTLRREIRVGGVAPDRSSIYRNLGLLLEAGLIETSPVKPGRGRAFRAKRRTGRTYELLCPGCHSHYDIFTPDLEEAILKLCRDYHLNPEGILVRIEARHLRERRGSDTESAPK